MTYKTHIPKNQSSTRRYLLAFCLSIKNTMNSKFIHQTVALFLS
ncbi:hypothetical protein [Moraxella nonliquefaciens]